MRTVNFATEGNSNDALVIFFTVTEVLESPKEDPIVHYSWETPSPQPPVTCDIIDGPDCIYKHYDK